MSENFDKKYEYDYKTPLSKSTCEEIYKLYYAMKKNENNYYRMIDLVPSNDKQEKKFEYRDTYYKLGYMYEGGCNTKK